MGGRAGGRAVGVGGGQPREVRSDIDLWGRQAQGRCRARISTLDGSSGKVARHCPNFGTSSPNPATDSDPYLARGAVGWRRDGEGEGEGEGVMMMMTIIIILMMVAVVMMVDGG